MAGETRRWEIDGVPIKQLTTWGFEFGRYGVYEIAGKRWTAASPRDALGRALRNVGPAELPETEDQFDALLRLGGFLRPTRAEAERARELVEELRSMMAAKEGVTS